MRAIVIRKILQKRDQKIRKYDETNKMYRSRKEQYDERRAIKNNKRTSLYNRGKYDGVIFVDVTENSEMMREVQRSCKRNKLKVKVVEKMRSTVRGEIQRSNPFKNRGCGRDNCILCELGMNLDCRTRGCVYEMKCAECSRKYRGQTGRSIFERINEHFKDWRDAVEGSVLFQHSNKYHGHQNFNVEVSILSRCFGEPTTRMITEAVLIDQLSDEETLNSKSEWTYVKLPRVSLT